MKVQRAGEEEKTNKLFCIYRFNCPHVCVIHIHYKVTIIFATIPEIRTNSDLLSNTSILNKDLLYFVEGLDAGIVLMVILNGNIDCVAMLRFSSLLHLLSAKLRQTVWM